MKHIFIPLLFFAFLVQASEVPDSLRQIKRSTPLYNVVATVMTSSTGGARLASGERNRANSEVFVALPSADVLGKIIGIYIVDTRAMARGIPVRDVGPHSIRDDYWERDGRPMAERGKSDKYKHAKNKAGIDLSLKLAKDLGLRYPFKGEVFWWFEEKKIAMLEIWSKFLPI